jgi:hypothetical protein
MIGGVIALPLQGRRREWIRRRKGSEYPRENYKEK